MKPMRLQYLHHSDICFYHPQHMQVNCTWDSTQHCSWQLDMGFDAPTVQYEHLTIS